MNEDKRQHVLERVKSLDGMTEHEWNEIKSIIDECFEKEKRDQEIRLSLETIEKTLTTSLFA